MREENTGDEISFWDVYRVCKSNKWLILTSTLVSVVAALVFAFVILHPLWEATAVVEVGHNVRSADFKPIEPVVNAIARMNSPFFGADVLKDAGFKKNDSDGFTGVLKASKVKDAELIEVSVRAASQAMALNQLTASVAYLQKEHAKILAPMIEADKKSLVLLSENIKSLTFEVEELRKKIYSIHDWNSFDATLLATVYKDKAAELRLLIKAKVATEDQLLAQKNYMTNTLGDVDVSDRPVSPNVRLIVLIAILAGLMVGVFIAFAKNSFASQAAR